mgnify:CR=1 FL=1
MGTPGALSSLPDSPPPLPSSNSWPSRGDLQGARREDAPQRIDEAGIQTIGPVPQPLCNVVILPVCRAHGLRAGLARLEDNGPRLGGVRDRMAPGDTAFPDHPGQNETALPVKDCQ